MKRPHDAALRKLRTVPVGDVAISVITKCELLCGVAVSPHREQDQTAVDAYLRHVQVLNHPEQAAPHYAEIRAALRRDGAMIGANDLFIAAHALCLGLTVATNNAREFGRVEGLRVENWTESVG